jgi:hypothetical protein
MLTERAKPPQEIAMTPVLDPRPKGNCRLPSDLPRTNIPSYFAERIAPAAVRLDNVLGQDRQGEPALDAELLINPMQVKFDGSFSDIQFARDHFVRQSFDRKQHDFAFARAQHVTIQGIRSLGVGRRPIGFFHRQKLQQELRVAIVRCRKP